jgi:hypothetical protein
MSDPPPTPPSELSPQWLVTVRLDGDDYPPTMTEIVTESLSDEWAALKDDRMIVGYTLERVKP